MDRQRKNVVILRQPEQVGAQQRSLPEIKCERSDI
jgi:hypothetical protein